MADLTLKQRAFVTEYLKDHNATRAAIAAGYRESHAAVQAHQLLKKPKVIVAIERAQNLTRARSDVTVDEIVSEMVKIAFANVKDVASWTSHGVKLKPSDKLTRDQAAAISEVKEDCDKHGNVTVSVKMHPKLQALTTLGKHLGMLNEKLDEKIQDAVEEILGDLGKHLPPEIFEQVVHAIRNAMGLPPIGRDADGEGGGEGRGLH